MSIMTLDCTRITAANDAMECRQMSESAARRAIIADMVPGERCDPLARKWIARWVKQVANGSASPRDAAASISRNLEEERNEMDYA